ncbi:hypothetical protein C8R43DRAFT_958282 [Mycena crocata]|nr:hypothetical protein C8R43DRAFT_958282 [Mycena crocata]
MPTHPTLTENRLNNVVIGFTGVVNTLEVLADALTAPFLEPISRTSRSLLNAVQAVKQNKGDCAQLIEETHGLLYAIVSIHIESTTGPELPPSMLMHLGKFTETLHKIHTYVEAQQEKSKIQQFFRQGEMSGLLKACKNGLQDAQDVFKVSNVNLLMDVADMQKYTEDRHQEALKLIETLSDGTMSDTASSLNLNFNAPI